MDNGAALRKFEWADLDAVRRLFGEIGGTAGTAKEADAELTRQILSHPSAKPEANLTLALVGGRVAGFCQLFPEIPISRAVAAGGVLPEFRGRGAGRLLLRDAIAQVEALGVSVMHVQAAADDERARRLLESEGFARVKEYWQMRWEGGELPPLNLRDNFSLRPFRLGEDEETLTNLQNAAFGEHWGFCPNTVEETAARVRVKNTEPDGIIFVMDGDKPAGYNWTLQNRNEHGGVGFVSMTGVHPDYRGNGLGTAVVVSGMRYLRERGVDAVELEVDSENTPARELYRKLGYRRAHVSAWYERGFVASG